MTVNVQRPLEPLLHLRFPVFYPLCLGQRRVWTVMSSMKMKTYFTEYRMWKIIHVTILSETMNERADED